MARDFMLKGTFLVEIDKVVSAEFQSCSELAVEVGESSYKQGGSLIAKKQPGATVTFPDITLERGVFDDDTDLLQWMKECVAVAEGTGANPSDLYRTIDVVQLDRAGNDVKRIRCFNAWCKRFSEGDFDATSDDHRAESVVIACDYWEEAA